MEDIMVELQNVSKEYKDFTALKNVSVSFERGKIHGIVGRNGSGKTVMFKCICGFTHYDQGTITVDGKIIGKDREMPNSFGTIIETPGFLPGYSAYKNLKFLADLRGLIGKEDVLNAIEKVGLDPESKKHVGKFSLGMRQRLGLAQAIMEKPSLLVLDEPLSGLDKTGLEEMREMFLTLKNGGTTIIIASHNSQDISLLCDTVSEMELGVLSPYQEQSE